jgi:hypothetical protein
MPARKMRAYLFQNLSANRILFQVVKNLPAASFLPFLQYFSRNQFAVRFPVVFRIVHLPFNVSRINNCFKATNIQHCTNLRNTKP